MMTSPAFEMITMQMSSWATELHNVKRGAASYPHPIGLHWVKRMNLLATLYANYHVKLQLCFAKHPSLEGNQQNWQLSLCEMWNPISVSHALNSDSRASAPCHYAVCGLRRVFFVRLKVKQTPTARGNVFFLPLVHFLPRAEEIWISPRAAAVKLCKINDFRQTEVARFDDSRQEMIVRMVLEMKRVQVVLLWLSSTFLMWERPWCSVRRRQGLCLSSVDFMAEMLRVLVLSLWALHRARSERGRQRDGALPGNPLGKKNKMLSTCSWFQIEQKHTFLIYSFN